LPIILYSAPLQVLVAVRGHPFDRTAFDSVFQRMEGVAATMVDHPAAARLMNPDGMRGYHALVLYDMPGLDFTVTEGAPRYVSPDAGFVDGFEELLRQGTGIVALHHALAGWPAWPGYADHMGGTFIYRPSIVRGSARLDSGYAHGVEYEAVVVADHPVTRRVPPRFRIRDELYLAEIFEADVTPLLRADVPFTRDRFFSAAAAVSGNMYNNDNWDHPPGSNLIGWTRWALNSPLVYLQPGDGRDAYENPHVAHMIEDAIRWVANGAAGSRIRP
jgi:type 1 glutamine amidotransferase